MEAAPVPDPFEDQEVRTACAELDVRRADDRAAVEVGRDLGVVGLRQGGDLLPLEQAADPAQLSWRIDAAPVSRTRENSYFVVSRSPVAIGIDVARATRAISSGISGGVGSSNQSGS